MKKYISILVVTIFFASCTNEEQVVEVPSNPSAEGFDAANSDAKAIEIADAVMESMGGRKAWDDTKVIKWNFFGRRSLIWDKHLGDVRIQFGDNDSNIFITNIFTHKGKIKLEGKELEQPDSILKYSAMAESIWINDAYWLFMPFKLKDSKTTLKYLEIDTAIGGVYSHKLQLTFNDIGDTPENKYWVYVDTTTMLVNQWAYFNTKNDTTPRFVTPWNDYANYGNILLSSNRGKRGISEIEVLDSVPSATFVAF